MLVSAIVGIDTRATMDLDATLRDLPLTETQIREAVSAICNIRLDDEVSFQMMSVEPIRKDDLYGGYRVRIDAMYDTILTPLSIDISTGDVITPGPLPYEFHGMFNPDLSISLWGYNIETILAEKVETILSRSTLTTRPRDFYDVYIIKKMQDYLPDLFWKALYATAEHRGSTEAIRNCSNIFARLETSSDLRQHWTRYQRQFPYAAQIEYTELIDCLREILDAKEE